jgi:biopolymer transport protein ExbD
MALKNIFEKLRSDLPSPSIGMAPLMDMVFLLLIFYVVTTTFNREAGVPITKARAESAVMLSKKQLVITIDQQGKYWLEGQQLPLARVVDRTVRAVDTNPKLQVIVLPDKDGRIDPMISLLDDLRAAKITDFAIGAEKEHGK